jgi:dihydrolipoamide dehydrogenase
MKEYDLIAIGTGSAMNIVEAFIQRNPRSKVAVIDKDEPGGICLTRGCIPTKILVYPAELIRTMQESKTFGIDIDIKKVNFAGIMERMRSLIYKDINMIRSGLSNSSNIDYYTDVAEFIAPSTLKVGVETIKSSMILLCTGSKPFIPPIEGIETVGYLTSNTILKISHLPKSIAVVGGGYIAAELGHFLSAMGSKVTIIGRNPQFLKQEEPEVSALALRLMQKHMTIFTNHEVQKAEKTANGKKLIAVNRATSEKLEVEAEEILVAAGRASNSDILHPEQAGIQTDQRGWITVNDHLETSQPNIWALGDANGKYLFKHVANYESLIVYYNAILKHDMTVDYHAIPHAVFTYPEVAGVGMKENEAITKFGKNGILLGMHRYQDTAKGEAMEAKEYFVKVIVQKKTLKILGAHIIGPYASILIQEIINLMYTPDQSAKPILNGMYIHPALNEVVQRAFNSLMPPANYHHRLEHS